MFNITIIGEIKLINNTLNKIIYMYDKSFSEYIKVSHIDPIYNKIGLNVLNKSDIIFGVPLSSSHIKRFIDDFELMSDTNKNKYLLIIPSNNRNICEDDQVLLYNVSMMNPYVNYCMHYDYGFILDTIMRYMEIKKRGII